MARQDDIEGLLHPVAPLFRSIALDAQTAAEEFKTTEWAREHLTRTAAVNQVAGTARWRIAADGIVKRSAELPRGVELSTSDGEQNQGRYYLRAPNLALLLTIRRRPHGEDDKPKILQLQMTEVLAEAPIAFDDEVVIYLSVPPLGKEPRFEVVSCGEVVSTYELFDLLEIDSPGIDKLPAPPAPEPLVRSALVREQEEDAETAKK
jgi:hypothetical protein